MQLVVATIMSFVIEITTTESAAAMKVRQNQPLWYLTGIVAMLAAVVADITTTDLAVIVAIIF